MKQIKGKLGTMYFEIVEDKFKLYDSDKEYVGYVEVASGNLEEEDVALLPLQLAQIEHISEIVDLGYCSNMMFAHSEEEVLEQLKNFSSEEEYEFDEDADIPINRINNNYFIVDFTEYI